MSVSFEVKADIKKYIEPRLETLFKQKSAKENKQQRNIDEENVYSIRKFLYCEVPKKSVYVKAFVDCNDCNDCLIEPIYNNKKKNNKPKPERCMNCYNNSRNKIGFVNFSGHAKTYRLVYSEDDKKVRYSMFINKYNVICIKIMTENMVNCCVFTNKFIKD